MPEKSFREILANSFYENGVDNREVKSVVDDLLEDLLFAGYEIVEL